MVFIIADASGQMSDIIYSDLLGNSNFHIINKKRLFKNRILDFICRINISLHNNLIIPLPLKNYFYKLIFGRFNNNNLCFFFGTSWYDPELFSYLKKKYPSAKFVFNFHDTIESKNKVFKNNIIYELKNNFDLIYSYNEFDVKKYNLLYMPDMYSKIDKKKLLDVPETDLVFIGAAKDRLELITAIYDKFKSAGYKCWFYITVNKNCKQNNKEGLIFTDRQIPFIEVISRHVKAKCILEITQSGCEDATLRFWDAVMFNKKIITNCQSVKKYKYYRPDYIQLFNSINDIDCGFISQTINIDYKYQDDLSPLVCFNNIERELENK